jgi:hypothetical protein
VVVRDMSAKTKRSAPVIQKSMTAHVDLVRGRWRYSWDSGGEHHQAGSFRFPDEAVSAAYKAGFGHVKREV